MGRSRTQEQHNLHANQSPLFSTHLVPIPLSETSGFWHDRAASGQWYSYWWPPWLSSELLLKVSILFNVHIEFQFNRSKRMQVAHTNWLTRYAKTSWCGWVKKCSSWSQLFCSLLLQKPIHCHYLNPYYASDLLLAHPDWITSATWMYVHRKIVGKPRKQPV